MLRLYFRSGHQGLQQDLAVGDRLLIGRGEVGMLRAGQQAADGTQIVKAGLPTVSQEHVMIHVEPDGRVFLVDLDSTNGTYLRVAPHKPVEIPANAELLLGKDLHLTLNSPHWGNDRLHEVTTLQGPADLLSFLRSRLNDRVLSVRLVSHEAARTTRVSALHELRLALIDKEQLLVEWQPSRTCDADTEGWLRAVVSLYNNQRELDSGEPPWEFTAVSPLRQQALSLAKRVAASSCTVLLHGASGSGKEVMASDLHNHSPRAGHPFVALNCGTLHAEHAEQAESQLFGQVKVGRNGVPEASAGLLEQADGGTLFLDEVDELPLALQIKLRRVLETRKFKPVGGKTERTIDIRVIAATHRPLENLVRDKTFRQDLYYRLSTIQISIPAIEPPDIAALAKLFLNSLSEVRGTSPSETEVHVLATLAASRVWPGGVRELRNAMERYVLLHDPARSVVANWDTVLTASVPLPAPVDAISDGGAMRPELARQTLAAVTVPECAPLAVSKQVDTLLFLSVVRQSLERNPRVGISEIARRVNLTYQGVLNRLKALELRLDGQDALPRIQARIQADRERLATFLPWVRHATAD